MPYTDITFGAVKAQLARRLNAPFWTDQEITLDLYEALRTWNAMTGYWRKRVAFPTVAATPFYDLASLAACAGVLDYTITDRDLINDLQFALMEPVNSWSGSTAWAGTDMFTMDDLTQAIQRRRNQFLLDSGCVVKHAQIAVGASPVGRFNLPSGYIDVRRFAWKDILSGQYRNLFREDEFSLNAFLSGWTTTPDFPLCYSVAVVPPISVQVAPIPLNNGTMDLLSVQSGTALDPTKGAILGIPDDFCWIVKYGALADLLSKEGQANDLSRAAYCEQRYQQGVNLARVFASVMQLQVNDTPVMLDALADWDSFDSDWQNSSGAPVRGAMAGLNMLALNKVPNGVYGISCDIVQKAPIPADDAAMLQVGQEDLDAILAIAEHAADFKMGGTEFADSTRLYEAAMKQASIYNGRLMEAAPFHDVLHDRERQEEDKRGRRKPRPAEIASGESNG